MPNTIIKASAGSGKTFKLSNKFLGILLRTDNARTNEKINTILASTFTRKAAGEILDRILTRLAEAALDKKKQEDFYKNELLADDNKDDWTEQLQKTAAELARNLYRLRISTLDSFFNKIATSFALELALPPGWSIIDETEYQRCIHEAVKEVFDESDKNEALKLLHLMHKGEQTQSVTQELVNLAKDWLPLVRSTSAEQWDHTETDKLGKLTLGKITEKALDYILAAFVEDKETLHQMLPKTQKGMPDGNCVKDFDKFMNLAGTSDWDGILAAKIGNNFALNNFVIRNKPVEPELCDTIQPIAQHARAIWAETLIHQTIATRRLLELIWEKLESILQRKRGYRFEDITFCLGDMFLRKPNALPQKLLSHRIDAPTEHMLLDEFQDTSISQWNILKPFVQSVTKGSGASFFCVGDLKQAIYGWRGGVAEIFETVSGFLEAEGAEPPERPIMNETRRNSQAVIDAVNQVFMNIGTNNAVRDHSPEAADKWQNWFGHERHQTLSPSKEQGYCVLEAAPMEETSSNDDDTIDTESPFWKYSLDRIEQIRAKHPSRSIGILFRSGKDIPTVLKGLKNRGVEASEEKGVPLTDSAAVQHILSVMTLIDHPGDTIVRFHLAHGPLKELLPMHHFGDGSAAESAAHHWREKLLSQGYGKTIKELMSALTPCDSKEMQRLEKLLELAYRFDEQATGTRTRQFIEAVNAARLATPGSAPVRVMTIHGAKGLEFDIVVLPDLNGRLIGQTPRMIVSKKSPTEPADFVLRWVSQDLRALLPTEPNDYQKAFVKWQDDQVKESLAVLYVAMTRARHELVMIVPEKKEKSEKSKKDEKENPTYANVLRLGLVQVSPLALQEEQERGGVSLSVLYENGDADWDDATVDEETDLPTMTWHALSDRPVHRNLSRATPSGMVEQHKSRGYKPPDASEYRRNAALRGTAIHACFANVEWLDDNHLAGTPAVTHVLSNAVEEATAGERGSFDAAEVVKEFLAICEQPEVRKILSRSSYSVEEDITIESERRFAVHWKGQLLHGSIDRLVVRRRGNEVIGLEIIDFKTDQKMDGETESDFLSSRSSEYVPQIAAYRQAVGKMYRNVDISAKIVFTSVDKVVPVD